MKVKAPPRPPRFHPELQVGQHFVLPPDCEGEGVPGANWGPPGTTYEVIRTSPCSALVRPARKRTTTYIGKVMKTRSVNGVKFKVDTGKTKLVEFTEPLVGFTISRCSSVVLVEGGGLDGKA